MKIKFTYVAFAIGILIFIAVGSGLFYWYELRPASIRRECSWVKVVDEPQPAKPAITKEGVEESRAKYEECMKDIPKVSDDSGWGSFNNLSEEIKCEELLKHEREAVPAKPGGEWYREANEKEYNTCLHQKGLE